MEIDFMLGDSADFSPDAFVYSGFDLSASRFYRTD
jgi:hypothetical protein